MFLSSHLFPVKELTYFLYSLISSFSLKKHILDFCDFWVICKTLFLKKDFIYLLERHRMREQEREYEGERSEGAADSLPSREPDVGPGTPGS